MKSNKKLIVIISIVVLLAVASSVFAYMFFMTDIFKSKQELFMKYFAQDAETFEKITDLKVTEIYENLKNQNKYESNTTIKMIHSEGGEVSNPLNNLAVKLDVQKNNEEQYIYVNGKILYEDEEYLEAEIIKEQEMYGVRFTDIVKQFVTVRNDENIESVANNIGIEVSQLQELINIIDKNTLATDGQGLFTLKDKYVNIIKTGISNGTFEKQKNAMITYNDVTTETNAYSVFLNSEQVHNILIETLNNVKNETEIIDKFSIFVNKEEYEKQIDDIINLINSELEVPTVKLTVYEQNQQTIRTVVEIGVYKITIENMEQNGELRTKIDYVNNDEAIQADLEITKNNFDNQESFEMAINVIAGDENYTITLSNQMQLLDNQIELNTQISHKQNITTMSLVFENKINIGNDFEKIQSLNSDNNIVLNDAEEQKMKVFIKKLNQLVSQVTTERINLLKQKFGYKNQENVEFEDTETEAQTSQVEINKFNSKFEFYTGDEVSAENVKMLLNIVKNHLASYENIEEESPEDAEDLEAEEQIVNIKLNIEKDVLNEEGANQVLEKINDGKKYKVLIFYKEANGLIDYITITEI